MEQHDTTLVAPRAPTVSYVDWPAIIAGAVIAAAIGGLMTTFGAALGFSTVSAERGEGSFSLWAVVTALWLVITLVLSYLAGGYVAGRMRRRGDEATADEVATRDGVNGLVVWALGVVLTAWFAAGAIGTATQAVGTAAGGAASAVGTATGSVVEAAGSAIGGAAQGIGAAAGAAVEGEDSSGMITYLNDALLRPALSGAQSANGMSSPQVPANDTADLARQTGVVLGNVVKTGELSEGDRDFLIAAAAQQTGLSKAEVEKRVDETVAKIKETRDAAIAEAERLKAEAEKAAEEAKQAAIDAAETARKSAILTAFLLTAAALVAGAASVVGAVRGGAHRDRGRFWGGLGYRL